MVAFCKWIFVFTKWRIEFCHISIKSNELISCIFYCNTKTALNEREVFSTKIAENGCWMNANDGNNLKLRVFTSNSRCLTLDSISISRVRDSFYAVGTFQRNTTTSFKAKYCKSFVGALCWNEYCIWKFQAGTKCKWIRTNNSYVQSLYSLRLDYEKKRK